MRMHVDTHRSVRDASITTAQMTRCCAAGSAYLNGSAMHVSVSPIGDGTVTVRSVLLTILNLKNSVRNVIDIAERFVPIIVSADHAQKRIIKISSFRYLRHRQQRKGDRDLDWGWS
jgi:hypothetical protein